MEASRGNISTDHFLPARLDLLFCFQFPSLPQRLMGNGVSEEGPMVQVKNWRHSVAENVSETGLKV